MIGSAFGTSNRPQGRTAEVSRFPVPYAGIDARKALANEEVTHALYSYNLVPSQSGLRSRKGYREWCVGVPAPINTIIPFDSIEQGGISDRLFAATPEGIYEVTEDATPTLKVAFNNQTVGAGYGVYTHYTGQAEQDVLLYADERNGLFMYDPSGNTWAQATGITGPVIENIRFVTIHKGRLWFTERDSNSAWYLDLDAVQGAATEFFFGSKFRYGGNVAGMFSWTADGGAGVDEYFVAVSRAGDVIVYQGSDPDTADDWGLVGTYYIGEVPAGGSFGTVHGGDLYLLSIYGLASLGSLLQGVDSANIINAADSTAPSAKVTPILQTAMQGTYTEFGWSVRRLPSFGLLLVSAPTLGSSVPLQLAYNYSVSGWGVWRGVPLIGYDSWKGGVYIGTADGRVCAMDVSVDNQLLSPAQRSVNGRDIDISLQTAFTSFGEAGRYKKVIQIRVDAISTQEPFLQSSARFDYLQAESLLQGAAPSTGTSFWDSGLWDFSVWNADTAKGFDSLRGSWGIGRYVGINLIGSCRSETTIVGWDVIHQSGGPLL